ncbi:MAG: shikimate dehydrogenase [Actinomycetota bacterium]|nr:shikimate dehydrogenase [Actinomycetota bacterium]
MHNAAFRALGLDWVYLAFDVEPGEVGAALGGMRALGIQGLSVTLPHKEDAAAHVDRLSPLAQAVGAVNAVVWEPGGVLRGENTDGPGFLRALRDDEGFDPANRRCLVVGAGGAARAVVKVLADAGATEVIVVNRTPERGRAVAALAGGCGRVGVAAEAGEADLVVNATPIGMAGTAHAGELPVDPVNLGPGQLVVDLVPNPAITPLVEAARRQGAVAANGLGMVVHQAALAFRLWTGEDPPMEVMSAAAVRHLGRRGSS